MSRTSRGGSRPLRQAGDIAIVGMACRFPGADSVSRYWRNLRAGRNEFVPPPADRWDHAAFFSASHRNPDKYYAPHGAFVDDVRSFAALEFGIPPRRLEVMDPQQRFCIEASHEALQDAGYGRGLENRGLDNRGRALDRRRVGTFIGLSLVEYRSLLGLRAAAGLMASGYSGDAPDDAGASALARAVNRVAPTRAFTTPGVLGNLCAAAVAQELDLGGPAFTVDAACASALVAVHDAVTYLRDGQIDTALAGGVYLNLSPEIFIAFSRIGAISGAGVCRPFDARADGFVLGEGVGVVVLRRLADALLDGDRIYAVLRGTAMNNDGHGDGPMSPRQEGQREVIGAAWEDAQLRPAEIGYVEAHGTGTTVGDRTELSALRDRLGKREEPVALGSVKANIGHTMSAAGIAGLMRAALAIHHRTLPPLANWEAPHPDHTLEDGTFVIPTEPTPWAGDPVAVVSSFGFGGTNAHLVLGRAPEGRPTRLAVASPPERPLVPSLVVLSADTGALLHRHLLDLLEAVPDAGKFEAIVHTLNLGRKPRAVRVAIVAANLEQLVARIQKAATALGADPSARGMLDRDVVLGDAEVPVPVAFLCPGQGMQRVGLLREWLAIPAFRDTLAEAESAVAALTPRPLRAYLYGEDATEAALTDTAIAQPAMMAIGLGVAAVLRSYGVEPSVVLGHSLGEFTATVLSGAVAAPEALRFVAARGRAMSDLPGDHGAMAAVMATAAEIQPHLPPTVVIANRNHPRQNVLSGPTPAIDLAVEKLNAAELKARRIPVSHAFHSPLLEVVQADVERGLANTHFVAPKLPMASCIAEERPATAEAVRRIYQIHATSPVDYVRGLEQCRAVGARVYVQLCSGSTLTAFARGSLDAGESILSIAGDGDDGGLGLLRVLALCAAGGHPVDLAGFGEGLTSLPATPLVRQTYWAITEEIQSAPQLAVGSTPTAAAATLAATTSAPRPAEAPPTDETDLRKRVLGVIAKVSAFPTDSLRDDQRLLDDLGFDSLMVNELSTRLGESFPGFPGIPRALFAQSPTVADLVRHVEGAGSAEVVPLTDPTRPLVAYRPTLTAAPASPLRRETPARTLHRPDLSALRALAPQDLVVYTGQTRPADEGDAALAGFVKALAQEWPRYKVAFVEGTAAEATLEASTADRDPEVVYRDEQRWVVGLDPVDLGGALEGALTSPDGRSLVGQHILLSGGTGWLGRVLAAALLEAGAAEVILLGTRADAGESLSALGARARYLRCDILGDLSPLKNLVVDGIVHAAGLLADGPVGKVDGSRAYDVKVNGLLQLVDALPDLRWVSAIGSYAGRFGNAWQTEYAAANNALVAVAAGLTSRGIPAQVQVWGPWADSDMVATIPADMRRSMRESGIWFVERAQGAQAFLATLGLTGEWVLGLDLPRTRRAVEVEETLTPGLIWLKDHALMGRPTVPMAMVLEWAAQLGGNRVEELTLYDGVVVETPVTVRRRLEGDRFTVWAGDRVAWRGRASSFAGVLTGETLFDGEPPRWDLPEFYARYTFHGPVLRGVVQVVGVGPKHVTGVVRPGIPQEWGERRWHFSPLAVDSALQLCQYWAQQRLGRSGFPVRVKEWIQLAMPDGLGELVVTARFGDAVSDRFRGDVTVTAPDGTVVALGIGVEAELRKEEGSYEPPEEHWKFERFSQWVELEGRLEMAEAMGITNPYFKVLEGTARDRISIAGRELIHFSGYNYLGFSGHPYVERRVVEAVRRFGTSVSASRVASGERPIHAELEARIAATLGVEAALVFTAGHATNVTTVGHLFGPKDLILHDELIHDSIFQGMKLAGSTRRPFPHGDTAGLARMLEQLRPRYEKVLVVVEGVYSMDGDLCDLPTLVALKKRHKCFLMVDEAHSFGVVGRRGYGVSEHFGVPGAEVDIWMGTLSKSLSSCGGYIAGAGVLIDLLKYTAPGFVYSAGLTPANTMAALASLELMEREPEHVSRLQHNCRYFYERCRLEGLDNGPSLGESAVCPVIVGNSYHALLLSDALFKRGINVQPILYPAVADNASRLRFFLSALHSEAQLAHTAAVCREELGKIRAES